MKDLLVLGANGPTGRRLVGQGLDRGWRLRALTRHPEQFPIRHDLLTVIGGDATDPATTDAAVDGCDAVISVIGTAYTRQPVTVYSASARLLVAAMARHGVPRLIAVTSAEVDRASAHQGRWFVDHVAFPLLRNLIGRTVYDDMQRMERVVAATDLDWTIVRPPGLTDAPGVGYRAAETNLAGMYCARDDLAAFLLDERVTPGYSRRVAAVVSPGVRVHPLDTLRREVLKR